MSIQTEGGTHTWCEKCGTLQLVQKVKHYIDYRFDPPVLCLVGCKVCRDIKIDNLLRYINYEKIFIFIITMCNNFVL